nr:discoidin domain-containing protein [uncultured Muribaculum sp.]
MNKKHIMLSLASLVGALFATAQTTDNPLPDWALGGFVRPEGANPIISPTDNTSFYCPMKGADVNWECADTFNPAAVVKDGKIYVLYRAEDDPNVGIGSRTSRIGLAEMNEDGTTVSYRFTEPVFYPTDTEISKNYEWDGGCEDPRVVAADIDGKTVYVMTYTAWSRGHDGIPRLSIAMSDDLLHWETKGPAFLTAHDGRFRNNMTKSGSIVTKIVDGVQKAVKVNFKGEDKYLMYWGEDAVFLATSDDLINWTPYVDDDMHLIRLIVPRPHHFDSQLTECGPPAVITDKGILLLYNGKNKSDYSTDPNYPSGTYAAGQVLFSLDDPTAVVGRLGNAFFRPMAEFEKTGQYHDGTVFIEGLVFNNGKWYLYYGCADSKVGVAVYDPATSPAYGDPVEGQYESEKIDPRIINAVSKSMCGKVRCRIYDKSGQTHDGESALFLNLGHIFNDKKWCENQTETPWVIWEFFDYYKFDGFAFDDAVGHENSQNSPEYWVEVSMDGNEWTEVLHKENVGDQDYKEEYFEPVEGRFVKATFKRADGAARIYGADIYGEYSRPYERTDGNISIGKTILATYDQANEKEGAHNLLTGNYNLGESKWCSYAADPTKDPIKYVVIDLEDDFDISSFKINDCKLHEGGSPNTNHYKISVSSEAPDLSLISPIGDSNTCWTTVVEKYDTEDKTIKEDVLEAPVMGRYVKLELPRVKKDGKEYNTDIHRIYTFDVFGQKRNTAGVANVTSDDDTEAPVLYYDLQGRPVKEPKAGFYIRTQGSKVSKVLVK